MRRNHGAAGLDDPRQQQARPAHVHALPEAQLELAVSFISQIGEQRRGGD